RNGRLLMLDARAALSAVMEASIPDAERFRETVGRAVEATLASGRYASIRGYGEMVDLLWKDGNAEGARRMEELWNDLVTREPLSLLCGYDLDSFRREAQTAEFQQVCRAHSHVLPTEQFTLADEDSRMREISLLQQRALSLESEIARRKELE